MATIKPFEQIPGVYLAELDPHADDRGRFLEIFRKEWFPQRNWRILQSNRSESAAGVLRGLHFHRRQVDYWYVLEGTIRAGLVDLRRASPAYAIGETIELSAEDNTGLFIPVGVAHGFLAVTTATLIYFVDSYYDGEDEFGVAWDDPDIAMDWGAVDPVLSVRDQRNPRLRDIPSGHLPA